MVNNSLIISRAPFTVEARPLVSFSASTTDLSSGFDSGTYLRKSPDQYSSRGSMESLDHPISSQHHSGAQHQHPLGHYSQTGSHPTYSSCHQLSSSRYTNEEEHTYLMAFSHIYIIHTIYRMYRAYLCYVYDI